VRSPRLGLLQSRNRIMSRQQSQATSRGLHRI
jgi:hypothetical protein